MFFQADVEYKVAPGVELRVFLNMAEKYHCVLEISGRSYLSKGFESEGEALRILASLYTTIEYSPDRQSVLQGIELAMNLLALPW